MTNTQYKLQPPVAKKRPQIFNNHGDERVDDYYWLRERANPDVIAYLEAENAYTGEVMAHTAALQSTLYAEMRARIQESDLSVPEEWGGYSYYVRTVEGQQYPIRCRKLVGTDSEEILLDENELAVGHDYLRVGVFRVSPNHKLLAYSVDTSGAESYTLYIKNLESGELLSDRIFGTYYGVEWGNDNQTLFYNVLDEATRPYKLFYHQLGTDPSTDVLVHHEEDEAYFLGIRKSKSQRYLFLRLGSKVTSETWFIPADDPTTQPTVIQPRQQEIEYKVEHAVDPHREDQQSNRFLITTNEDAVNFRVMETAVEAVAKDHWRELIAHNIRVKIDAVEPFRNHLVVYQREGGFRQMQIRNLQTGAVHRVEFPEPVYAISAGRNPDFNSNIVRFTYESMTTPDSVYDYNMDDHSRELRKQKEVRGGFDAENYASERLFADAKDGTKVPISLVRRKDALSDKPGPLLLYGYGSYGVSIDPSFSTTMLSLLDRGVTMAIAHVRGGGEMGRPWYEDGKFLHKKNTFTDFIDCAEHLIADGVTTSDQLVAMGRSAGGLLMGAITVMRPDLFKGIVAGVPFVDVINTMLDPSIPLTVIEYEEWGNPHDPIYYAYMKSYSPYDNTTACDYPNILATAGLNDPRVQYWEPAKWVAKLRMVKVNDSRLILKTNMGAGHGGSSGRFDYLEEVAFEYAFVLDLLGIDK